MVGRLDYLARHGVAEANVSDDELREYFGYAD
jgi:hypothetical protein